MSEEENPEPRLMTRPELLVYVRKLEVALEKREEAKPKLSQLGGRINDALDRAYEKNSDQTWRVRLGGLSDFIFGKKRRCVMDGHIIIASDLWSGGANKCTSCKKGC